MKERERLGGGVRGAAEVKGEKGSIEEMAGDKGGGE